MKARKRLVRRLVIHAVEEVIAGPDLVLARDLMAARQNAGLTRIALGQRTGIAVSELVRLEAGELSAFASPERARLVLLAYCDALSLEPASFLGRLEPYLANQLLVPRLAPVGGGWNVAGLISAAAAILVALAIAWQVATVLANASGAAAAVATWTTR